MTPLLRRTSWRHLQRHPWQAALAVLGVALGVAVAVAVDLAGESAARAFRLATEAVSGRTTHHILGGPSGIPDSVYVLLRRDLGFRTTAPVVEGYAAAVEGPTRTLQVLGVDPLAEAPLRPYLAAARSSETLRPLLTTPASVVLSATTAAELGVRPGEPLPLRVAGSRTTVAVTGLLHPEDETSSRALDGLLVMDIAAAQELLSSVGRIHRIDLVLGEGDEGEALATLQRSLPPGFRVEEATGRARATLQMASAFQLNLQALSLLALIFGMFLIYNSITFSVVQRRSLIGTLRALGVTRREVLLLVLGEALIVGLLGALLGLGLGALLGQGLVRLVTRTINDLYFVVTVRELVLAPAVLVKGAALGVGATLLAAIPPAVEAAGAAPRVTLTRSALETRTAVAVRRGLFTGALLLALGIALLAPSAGLLLTFVAVFVLILGFAVVAPVATVGLMRLARVPLGRAFGALGRMAAGGVVATLSRTAPAVAALSVAVAVGVAVGLMIDSFRSTVERWLEQTLQADVYVSAPGTYANRSDAEMDPSLIDRFAALPGVAGFSTYRNVAIAGPRGELRLVAIRLDPRGYPAFHFREGNADRIWPAFRAGEAVIVSEPLAYRLGLGVGSLLTLRTAHGPVDFPVAGVFYDYGTDRGTVMVDRSAYDYWWQDPGFTSVALFAEPGTPVDTLMARVRAATPAGAEVVVRSNLALRSGSLAVFDRTFAVTGVLRLLALAVAFVGVLSALMAIQLERTRELGVLRATGVTPREVGGLVLSQTGLLGLAAGLLAVPIGIALALVMVFVVNRRSFGWTLQFQLDPEILLQGPLLAVVAALLAGVYPAWRMSTTPPAFALREE